MEGRGRGISSFLRLLPEYENESLISQLLSRLSVREEKLIDFTGKNPV